MDARYRLAPMRDARARHERAQRGDLASAVGDAQVLAAEVAEIASRVARARAALAAATDTRDRMLAQGDPEPQGPTSSTTLAHFDCYLRRLRRDLEAARSEHLRAEARHRGQLEVIDAAQGRLMLARAEREIIERHFAAWRAERRKLAERRAD